MVTAAGQAITKPINGGGPNAALCKDARQKPTDQDPENGSSVGILLTYNKFRFVDLGDLPWAKELELMCPVNKLGKADIYIATHHGFNFSGSQALVYGIAARVAIMENGAKKGGSPSAWDIVHSAPGLSSLYQLHWSEEGGAAHNSAPEFLANLDGPDGGHYFKITAHQDGSFDVLNSRTGKTKSYSPHM